MLRCRYRRRVLPKVALGLVPVTLATLITSVVADGWVAWTAAVWFGAALCFWFFAADAVPAHIERWATGGEGGAPHRTGAAPPRARWLASHARS